MAMRTTQAPTSTQQQQPAVMALVCIPQPEERDFVFLQGEIRLRQLHIERLESEIGPLLDALNTFEWEYKARVGTLQSELRSLNHQIQTFEHRTARIHARLVADPDGILGEIFSREELQEIGELFGIEVPASWFAREDELDRQEREREWRFHESAGEEAFRRDRGRKSSARKEPDAELRSLYRRLARLCHPDLATSDADRTRRQELMHRINAAWHDRDIDALREIEHDRIGTVGWSALRGWAERLVWARRELVRLDARIIALTERLQSLRSSDTFPLWFNPSLGNSVITNRTTTLRIDIANAQHRLDQAREAFRQALRHYAIA
jgi:hypothetical protein